MNTKIVDQNVTISYTIVTHFRARKLRLKLPFMPIYTIPKHANFQFDPNIDITRNLHINVQISYTIILILDQVTSIKIKTSIYA